MKNRVAAGLVAALGASALIVPQASATEAPALAEGSLNWPFKDSFINYLDMPIVHGEISATEGAQYANNSFDFPLNPEESNVSSNGNASLDFDGKVQFKGHPAGDGTYQMDITIDDLQVNIEGTEATILGDYHTQGKMPGQDGVAEPKGDDVVLATFTLESAIEPVFGEQFAAVDRPSILGEGAESAFQSYKAGSEGGNVDLTLAFSEAPETPETEAPGTPETEDPAADDNSSSSELSTGGIIGVILAILGVLGIAGTAAFQSGLLPKLPF